jgi:hypothetical protein
LTPKERKVIIKRYHSSLPEDKAITWFGSEQKSADQYLSNLSKEKEKLNNQFLNVLKEA